MKEFRFFYVPNAAELNELPQEEAQHAIKVLRMKKGDEMVLADGKGYFYEAVIVDVDKRQCQYKIEKAVLQEKSWKGHIHIAVAPTKNIDRTEWFVEKATEIGFDELSFLNCKFSERTKINNERIERIVTSAFKQSRKSEMPVVNEMIKFADFINRDFEGNKYICHCYEEFSSDKRELFDILTADESAVILIGPEGDFSLDEVRKAHEMGFKSVGLGKSRLRTETAALVAVHMMHLKGG